MDRIHIYNQYSINLGFRWKLFVIGQKSPKVRITGKVLKIMKSIYWCIFLCFYVSNTPVQGQHVKQLFSVEQDCKKGYNSNGNKRRITLFNNGFYTESTLTGFVGGGQFNITRGVYFEEDNIISFYPLSIKSISRNTGFAIQSGYIGNNQVFYGDARGDKLLIQSKYPTNADTISTDIKYLNGCYFPNILYKEDLSSSSYDVDYKVRIFKIEISKTLKEYNYPLLHKDPFGSRVRSNLEIYFSKIFFSNKKAKYFQMSKENTGYLRCIYDIISDEIYIDFNVMFNDVEWLRKKIRREAKRELDNESPRFLILEMYFKNEIVVLK